MLTDEDAFCYVCISVRCIPQYKIVENCGDQQPLLVAKAWILERVAFLKDHQEQVLVNPSQILSCSNAAVWFCL